LTKVASSFGPFKKLVSLFSLSEKWIYFAKEDFFLRVEACWVLFVT